MPFDGYEVSLVQLFDEMLRFFGPNGEQWIQGEWLDASGNRCLIGALAGLRAKLKLPKKDRATLLLRAAIRGHHGRRMSIMAFNDRYKRSFADIHKVLLTARDMAITGELDRQLTLPV
jgi:hypothetical protein